MPKADRVKAEEFFIRLIVCIIRFIRIRILLTISYFYKKKKKKRVNIKTVWVCICIHTIGGIPSKV